jgi:hypothetical protein
LAFDERAACEAAIYGSFTVDPEPDGRRRAGLEAIQIRGY